MKEETKDKITFTNESMYLETVKSVYIDILNQKNMLELALQNANIPKDIKGQGLMGIFHFLIDELNRNYSRGLPTKQTYDTILNARATLKEVRESIDDIRYQTDCLDTYDLDIAIETLSEHQEAIEESGRD